MTSEQLTALREYIDAQVRARVAVELGRDSLYETLAIHRAEEQLAAQFDEEGDQ